MDCRAWHELISARIDDELTPGEGASLDHHLQRCPACRTFADAAAGAARVMRVRSAEPAPDLTARILTTSRRPSPVLRRFARLSLAWLAVVQLVAGLPALLFGEDSGATVHIARHLGSFDVAIAVGLLVAAWRPSRARSLLPIAAALAACVLVSASLDLLDGSTSVALEAPHLVQLLAVAFLWLLSGAPRPRWASPAATMA
jgi:predicted anti-sigma-YlaC factor YlaD